MITDKLKALAAAKAQVDQLQAAINSELNDELAALPARYGFDDARAFAAALLAASGKRRGRPPGRSAKAAQQGKTRRKRAVVTDQTRAEVKKMVKEKKTGSEIAKRLGISLPTVQNIKKALGLVKKR
jgi:hypothetical protein